jgi:hypothetical protein
MPRNAPRTQEGASKPLKPEPPAQAEYLPAMSWLPGNLEKH